MLHVNLALAQMSHILSLIVHHGYLVVFLIVLAEAVGMPLPSALALIAGGAAVASGALRGTTLVALTIVAMLLGDTLFYLLGNLMGWNLLGLLCRVSLNPETCILRAAESFYKRGRAALLVAKFIPGINTMAPPLAGSMEMPFVQFLGLDFLGATVYAFAYLRDRILFPRFHCNHHARISNRGTRRRDRRHPRCHCLRRPSHLAVLEASRVTASCPECRLPSWRRSCSR